MDSDQAATSTAAMEIERVPSEPKSVSGVPPIKPKFEPLKAQEMSDGRVEFRKVSVPAHRFTPLKKAWMEIYTPIFEQMKIDVRMNLKVLQLIYCFFWGLGSLSLQIRANDAFTNLFAMCLETMVY